MNWKYEKKQLKDLYENKKNPRSLSKHNGEKIKESIEKFGLCEPIVINTTNRIIGGHQRFKMLLEMGCKEAFVSIPDTELTEKDEEKLLLMLNKNQGDWDYDLLANNWDNEALMDCGFTQEDLFLEGGDTKETKKHKTKYTIKINFESKNDLEKAEAHISNILDQYDGCTYKTGGV